MNISDFFQGRKENSERREKNRRLLEANERFNIRRIEGVDVITYNGVIVSRGDDTDILERLNEYKDRYING